MHKVRKEKLKRLYKKAETDAKREAKKIEQ
jgi:hypothetical protein